MSEMVEKVARAIWAERVRACAENGVGLEAWGEGAFFVADAGEQSVSLMNNILGEARAAIEAMRTPTEAMLEAGANIYDGDMDKQARAYRAMIYAAMGGEPNGK
jgi:hypothetical protein